MHNCVFSNKGVREEKSWWHPLEPFYGNFFAAFQKPLPSLLQSLPSRHNEPWAKHFSGERYPLFMPYCFVVLRYAIWLGVWKASLIGGVRVLHHCASLGLEPNVRCSHFRWFYVRKNRGKGNVNIYIVREINTGKWRKCNWVRGYTWIAMQVVLSWLHSIFYVYVHCVFLAYRRKQIQG